MSAHEMNKESYVELKTIIEHMNKIFNNSESANPLDKSEKCRLITAKSKKKYYKFTYDPQYVSETLSAYPEWENIKKNFDFEKKNNCCNCVAISIYRSDTLKDSTLLNYLLSIIQSAKNMALCMNEWILRLYIDYSVHIYCDSESAPEEIYYKYGNILAADNIEVYIYDCDSFINVADIGKRKTFRFMPLIDDTVNICAIREADGIVTRLDCNQLLEFANQYGDNVLYILLYNHSAKAYTDKIITPDTCSYSYSDHLMYYKEYIENEYFKSHHNVYELLAGGVASGLKIKRDVYYDAIKHLEDKQELAVNKINKERIPVILVIDAIRYTVEQTANPLLDRSMLVYDDSIAQGIFNFGFDEMLLLYLFRDIISLPFTSSDDNKEMIKQRIAVDNITFYGNNDLFDKSPKSDNVLKRINALVRKANGKDKIYRTAITDGLICHNYDITRDTLLQNTDEDFDKLQNSINRSDIIMLSNRGIADNEIELHALVDSAYDDVDAIFIQRQ